MPLKYSPRKPSETRPKVYVTLVALLLLSAAALSGVGARAQRKNDNSSQQQQQGRSSRRVIVGRGSETASGSRTTITADDSLNDYSAYRSGDRFYVVLPKSAAGAVSKGSGKGYTDVQVQQRGDSVVVSYKVQPGAKPRVEQKFNRLDVVFDVKDGGQPAPSGQQTAGASQTPAGQNGNPGASEQQQQAAQQRPAPTPAAGNERRPAEAAQNAGLNAAPNPSNNAAQTAEAAPQTGAAQTQPAPSPAGGQTAAESGAPAAAPTAEPQIAQNQPPAPIAPITNPSSSNAGAQAGVSFGTMLVNNWPVALLVALLVVGLGLVVYARRPSGHTPAELEAAEGLSAAALLEEPRAARLRESSPAEVVSVAEKTGPTAEASAPVATVAPLVTTAAHAPGKKDKKKKKNRKGKAAEPLAEALPLAEVEAAEEPSVAAPPAEVVAASAVEAAVEEAPAAEAEAVAVETPTAEAEAATVEAAAVTPAQPAEVSTQPAEDSTSAVEGISETAAAGLVLAGAGVVAAEASAAEPATESVAEPVAESAIEPVAEPPAESVTSIEPAAAPDPEEVQAQTRSLLEGEPYERSVIGSEDSMARQMIGAELLSALAGRNAERRERARAAFVEHGYFDEKTRDVREAAAPAERAAAARSLAIVGDRAASPHLISALEDDSTEVRRAAVEALGALREPAAVEPLEALLLREKSERNRIPNRIIQHAIETCRFAAVEEARAAEKARAEAEASAAAEAAAVAEEVPAPAAEAAEAETVETKAVEPPVEGASALVEEPAPQVEEAALSEEVSTREVEVAPAATPQRVEEVAAGETAIVAAPDEAEASAAEAAAPFETEPASVWTAAAEAQPVVEIEPAAEARPEEAQPPVVEAPALYESASEDEGVASQTLAAESNAVEPFFAEPPQAFEPAVAEPQVTEETRVAAEASGAEPAEEAGKSLAPFVSSAAPEESARVGEWVELDMSDIRAAEPAAAVTAPQPPELLFESSSGEAFSSAGVAEPEEQTLAAEPFTFETARETPTIETAAEAFGVEAPVEPPAEAVTAPLPGVDEKGVVPFNERSMVPAAIQQRLTSRDAFVRAAAITELSHVDTDEAFQQICTAFDDEAKEVRSAAARALYELRADRAESFTRALREAGPERRRNVGAAISSSGLAGEAISQLTGESRDKTYEAFSLLFLMAKAGEVQPLVRAIEGHPNNEVRLAVVKLLALSGQKEILPAFRRLAVRGSLPTEVRSAVMEAIYQISSSNQPTPA